MYGIFLWWLKGLFLGVISCLRWLFVLFGLMGLNIGYVKGCFVLRICVKFVGSLGMLSDGWVVILIIFFSVVIILDLWLNLERESRVELSCEGDK